MQMTNLATFDQALDRIASGKRDDLPSVPASRLIFEALLHLEMADALFINEPRDIQEHVRVALGLLKLIRESR